MVWGRELIGVDLGAASTPSTTRQRTRTLSSSSRGSPPRPGTSTLPCQRPSQTSPSRRPRTRSRPSTRWKSKGFCREKERVVGLGWEMLPAFVKSRRGWEVVLLCSSPPGLTLPARSFPPSHRSPPSPSQLARRFEVEALERVRCDGAAQRDVEAMSEFVNLPHNVGGPFHEQVFFSGVRGWSPNRSRATRMASPHVRRRRRRTPAAELRPPTRRCNGFAGGVADDPQRVKKSPPATPSACRRLLPNAVL